jgi:hypothetical protein
LFHCDSAVPGSAAQSPGIASARRRRAGQAACSGRLRASRNPPPRAPITLHSKGNLAAEIDSQATNHTRHDWRRYDHDHTPIRPHALPPMQAELCRRLVRRLGLAYGAIDLIVAPDGRHVFVEINPNGQYLWIEDATGLPITEAVCELLCRRARQHRVPASAVA